MASKPFPPDTLKQAQDALQGWKSFDPAFKVGELTLPTLETEVAQLVTIQNQLAALEKQATDLRNKRDTVSTSVWDKVKRARRGVQAIYGDDSSQYELMGGTRLSERKTPVRAAKSPAA